MATKVCVHINDVEVESTPEVFDPTPLWDAINSINPSSFVQVVNYPIWETGYIDGTGEFLVDTGGYVNFNNAFLASRKFSFRSSGAEMAAMIPDLPAELAAIGDSLWRVSYERFGVDDSNLPTGPAAMQGNMSGVQAVRQVISVVMKGSGGGSTLVYEAVRGCNIWDAVGPWGGGGGLDFQGLYDLWQANLPSALDNWGKWTLNYTN